MGKERPAPGDLEHVRSFVNTRDIEERTDELMTPRETPVAALELVAS